MPSIYKDHFTFPVFHFHLISVVLLLSFACPLLMADELHLRDGIIMEGIISIDGDEYVVSNGSASTRIHKRNVVKHVKKLTLMQRYKNLESVADKDSFEQQMSLGNWCRLNNLPDEAQVHFNRAVELEPDNSKARKAAGYYQHKGKWLTRAEYMDMKGKALYKGKWIDKVEAKRLIESDRIKKMREEGYKKSWALIVKATHRKADETVVDIADELADMGPYAMKGVLRGVIDTQNRAREVSFMVLARHTSAETLKEMLKRLQFEKEPYLSALLITLLSERKDRDAVLKRMLDMCLHSGSSRARKRSWKVMQLIADKRVIDVLVDQVDFNPVPESEMKKEKLDNGTMSSMTYKKPRKPYYPAFSALCYLTEMTLVRNKDLWKDWWQKNRETFEFKPYKAVNYRNSNAKK